MENNKKTLQDIFDEDDDLGLLDIKTSASTQSDDDRFLASFKEINAFYSKNKRVPTENKGISEHQLFIRLKNILANPQQIDKLKVYDTFGLLDIIEEKKETEKIPSWEDILNDDDLDLLSTDDYEGLFDFKHVKNTQDRESTDFVAKRKPCKDFEKYEALFKGVQKDLKENKRKLVEFKLGNLREGSFYVHNGVVFLLEKIEMTKAEHYREDGTRVRADGRTRCIFENGTESNMLKRSVEKILYANGKAISENEDVAAQQLVNNYNNISAADQTTGFIYVLKSKSTNPKIKSIDNLYKIGYSTTEVSERIKNAIKEPTYLMAEVEIAAVFECYNFNPQKMEQLLHTFFGKACLNIDVFDEKGKRHTPREWFIAPMPIIEQVVHLIINNQILEYGYDVEKEEIVAK